MVLIDADGRVLVASRPEGKAYAGWWEFPGGKLEQGETPEQALARELQEELGIITKPNCFSPLTFVSHTYEDMDKQVLILVFACRVWQGQVTAREGQTLAWTKPSQFYEYKFVPADVDLLPIIRTLLG